MRGLVRGRPDGLRHRRLRALQPQGLENMMGRSLLTNGTRHQSESDSNGLTGPTISESRSECARKAWERGKRCNAETFRWNLAGQPTPARQSLASGRKRVLRGAG